MKIDNKNVIELYNLPKDVKFCTRCTISNQRPRISFDKNGVCSACLFSDHKRNIIDWDLRHKELEELCNKFRKNDGSYDVVVPCSGGKDGSFVAHMLKYKYNMNPLTVTWSPHVYTDIGRRNLDNFINIGGFDHILGTMNGVVHRKMSKLAFMLMGDNFQPFIYGQANFPLRIAVQHDVSLIMYGENGEVEYGGDQKNADKPTRTIEDQDEHYFSGKPPDYWEQFGLTKKDLFPYFPPKHELVKKQGLEIHFMSYYKFWDPQENFYYCVKNTGFETNTERSEGTFSKYASLDDKTDGYHYYLSYIKFGIGRATSDTAHEIRDDKITRDEGRALVKKYDGEFPRKNFEIFLKYLDITQAQFDEVIDSWRSPHIWKKIDNEWKLKHAVWYEE
tara:strand:+ start:914 stop:2083 length:1170 start_codon:yes stop_codon:yes gene_type:complete